MMQDWYFDKIGKSLYLTHMNALQKAGWKSPDGWWWKEQTADKSRFEWCLTHNYITYDLQLNPFVFTGKLYEAKILRASRRLVWFIYLCLLTVISVNSWKTTLSLSSKQGKPVRVFGFALACWEFPSPFSHFVWLRVSAKRWIAPKDIPSKIKKTRSQTPIKSASDSGH